MTRKDAIKLVGLVVTAYPNSDKFNNQVEIKNAVNMWAEFFENDDASIVGMALKKHIAVCKFPPQIAEIKEIIAEICNPDIITPTEAWAAVALHIDTSSEYECLPEPERVFPVAMANAIKAVGYRNLRKLRRGRDYANKKAGLDRVAFLQAYEPEYERMRKNAMLPHSLRLAIAHTQAALSGESRLFFEKTKAQLEAKQADKMKTLRRIEHAERRFLLENKEGEVNDND
ncbi:MAG: replicative helicase loader/inhibitor [Defluviitaleaceae bacterium]|nr:replicative helicase loader/inhibitor [Defluviitaleaceae bacterium]